MLIESAQHSYKQGCTDELSEFLFWNSPYISPMVCNGIANETKYLSFG